MSVTASPSPLAQAQSVAVPAQAQSDLEKFAQLVDQILDDAEIRDITVSPDKIRDCVSKKGRYAAFEESSFLARIKENNSVEVAISALYIDLKSMLKTTSRLPTYSQCTAMGNDFFSVSFV